MKTVRFAERKSVRERERESKQKTLEKEEQNRKKEYRKMKEGMSGVEDKYGYRDKGRER